MIYSLGLMIPVLLAALMLGSGNAHAQPKGWPCDYGYRPGNTWFYRSVLFPDETFTVSVVRDSMGMDGKYWVYIAGGYWYRIDSSCTFDSFLDPRDLPYSRKFIAAADSGDRWVVDSNAGEPSRRAILYDTYDQYVFGKKSRISEVRYYFDKPDNWFGGNTWAEGFGVIAIRSNPTGYYVLIGTIIDGRHYGTTSGFDYEPVVETGRMTLWPMPTSDAATLRFHNNGARTATLTIHDLLGRTVRHLQLNDLPDAITTLPLNLSALPAGAYIVTVEANRAVQRTPLVIAR